MPTFTNPTLRTTADIINGATAGHYPLPDNVTAALTAIDTLTTETQRTNTAATATNDTLAAQVLAAAHGNGKFPTLDDVATDTRRKEAAADRQRLLSEAVEPLETELEVALRSSANAMLTVTLTEALNDTLEAARHLAATIGTNTSDAQALRAGPDVADAWLALEPLVARHRAIRKAQMACYRISPQARYDVDGRFIELRNINDVHPHPRMRPPWPTDNPAGYLVWLVTSPAEPWVPTVEQRDQRFQHVYADHLNRQTTGAAVAAGAIRIG